MLPLYVDAILSRQQDLYAEAEQERLAQIALSARPRWSWLGLVTLRQFVQTQSQAILAQMRPAPAALDTAICCD